MKNNKYKFFSLLYAFRSQSDTLVNVAPYISQKRYLETRIQKIIHHSLFFFCMHTLYAHLSLMRNAFNSIWYFSCRAHIAYAIVGQKCIFYNFPSFQWRRRTTDDGKCEMVISLKDISNNSSQRIVREVECVNVQSKETNGTLSFLSMCIWL